MTTQCGEQRTPIGEPVGMRIAVGQLRDGAVVHGEAMCSHGRAVIGERQRTICQRAAAVSEPDGGVFLMCLYGSDHY